MDLTFSYPSWNDASLFDYLPNNPNQLIMNPQELYLGPNFSKSMLLHPYVSPLHAENFDYLPPIMIQSGGCESLRDEIDALQKKISQSKSTFLHNEVYDVIYTYLYIYIYIFIHFFRFIRFIYFNHFIMVSRIWFMSFKHFH